MNKVEYELRQEFEDLKSQILTWGIVAGYLWWLIFPLIWYSTWRKPKIMQLKLIAEALDIVVPWWV